MKKLIAIAVALALLLAMVVTVPVAAAPTVMEVYPDGNIQAAVDTPGVTMVIVHAGEYHQSVIISTNDITLMGEEGTILDGDGPADPGTTLTGIGIRLLADTSGVTVRGFEIRDYAYGIDLSSSSNNIVIKNKVSGSGEYGIALVSGSNNNVVDSNEVSGTVSKDGIYLRSSSNNVVSKNKVTDSGRFGIILYSGSSNNAVEDNKVSVSGLSEPGDGIILTGSANNNVIENNEVSDSSRNGISLEYSSSDNLIKDSDVSGSGRYDLRWDGSGTGNTWEENEYNTSNLPLIIPPGAIVTPLVGAQITVTLEPDGTPIAQGVTDSNGEFSFSVAAGSDFYPGKIVYFYITTLPKKTKLLKYETNVDTWVVTGPVVLPCTVTAIFEWVNVGAKATGNRGGFAVGGFSLA